MAYRGLYQQLWGPSDALILTLQGFPCGHAVLRQEGVSEQDVLSELIFCEQDRRVEQMLVRVHRLMTFGRQLLLGSAHIQLTLHCAMLASGRHLPAVEAFLRSGCRARRKLGISPTPSLHVQLIYHPSSALADRKR